MTALLDVEPDGLVKGLHVVGFHGDVAADETPAKLGPVYVDDAWCHARIVEIGPAKHTPANRLRIESVGPPFPKDEKAPLPGHGTRIGPWPAQIGNTIMAVGPEERRLLGELRKHAGRHGKGRLAQFLDWFAGDSARSDDLCCERQDGIAIWYCHPSEGYALLECVQRAVKAELFAALRSKKPWAIEDAAWWFSRAAIADEDIYLAGAALRLVDSPDWKILVREGLQLRDEREWKKGLEEAEWHIEHPPPVSARDDDRPAPPRYAHRAAVHRCFVAGPAKQKAA